MIIAGRNWEIEGVGFWRCVCVYYGEASDLERKRD